MGGHRHASREKDPPERDPRETYDREQGSGETGSHEQDAREQGAREQDARELALREQGVSARASRAPTASPEAPRQHDPLEQHSHDQGAAAVELRELESMDELRPLERLQREVWGIDDLEVVPATAMRAAVHAGGLVVGALVAGEAIGFAFGFVSAPHGRGMSGTGMHSHMAAVLPGFRRRGVGRRLKRYQASWCASRGLRWISWTFDPLRAENARFNLAVLGARCYEYLADFYGPMPGALGGGIESDRLLAVWAVGGADRGADPAGTEGSVGRAAAGANRGAGSEERRDDRGLWLLPPGDEPQAPDTAAIETALERNRTLLVAVPPVRLDVFSRPELAMSWRAAHRLSMKAALDRGWAVTGFHDGAHPQT